jgi:hypothetical protein
MHKILLIAGLTLAVNAFAGTSKHVCVKDGDEIAVTGKDDAEKKKACEDAGGSWTAKKEKSESDSGGGGGW